jgi:hypothetical protein
LSIITRNAADLPELAVSNPMLGDRAALKAAWERDGYWLFRDVLDPRAFRRLQQAYLDELIGFGIVDPGTTEPVFNGKSLRPEIVNDGFSGLRIRQPEPWHDFVSAPVIIEIIKQLLGHAPRRLPVGGSRVFPPDTGDDLKRDRYNGVHQDAFFNEGYGFVGCWVPIWDATRAAGGLAIAPGAHRGPLYHDANKPPYYPIPAGAIPDAAWRTADFHAGDILMFHHKMPHTGIRNRSAKNFRVSFDVRFLAEGDPGPLSGKLLAVSNDSVAVKDSDGKVHTVPIAAGSFCRGLGEDFGLRLPPSEIPKRYTPGLDVIVTVENGKLKMLRGPND